MRTIKLCFIYIYNIKYIFLADVPLPDLSRPPPLLNNIPPLMSLPPPDFGSEDYLVSKIPYYELPAGLMVPLVKVICNLSRSIFVKLPC